jgi:flagellar motor switch protein FliG
MSTVAVSDIPGPRKAAILVVLLGEEVGGRLLRHLPREQVAIVAREIATLGPIEPDLAKQILDDYFVDAIRPSVEQGGPDRARRMLLRAELPEDQVNRLLGGDVTNVSSLLAPLLHASPPLLARAMAQEHPQTIALVLLHLRPERAAKALVALPEALRAETVRRMASMRRVRAEVIGDVASSLKERLDVGGSADDSEGPDGLEKAAALLSTLSRAETRKLLEEVEREDPDRAAALRSRVFTFESLVLADDRGIQELLRQVETKTLAVALVGAEESIQKKILGNLSERASAMLKDEIEYVGKVRPEDQTAARKEVLATAQKLEEEGRLVFEEPADGEGGSESAHG